MGENGTYRTYLVAWAATTGALGICVLLLAWTDHPLLLASLGGSCVILFGMPESEMAQPRSFIGGHLLASVVGLGFEHVFGSGEVTAIAAVATALILMMATRTIHSPAGANPIIIMTEGAGWGFLVAPLALGLAVLLIAALLVNNASRNGRRFPQRWV
jgi:CBS-domain-containing membrane protein